MTRTRVRLAAVLLLASTAASCAFYNTFYLARRYYMKATDGQPYEVDRENTTQRSNYTKSADYSKKLLGVYPKSKWVDDAWLMWARTLVGTDDPLKAVTMLQEFETRFPKSELRPDAEFFLGLSYRAARRHESAVGAFDEFLAQSPKHPLVPYAFYERSKAFMSLQRYREAAESAGEILKRFPKHPLADRALRQRAEARYQQHDWAGARADFHEIGARALTDVERLRLLLREVDCLESNRDYDGARALLRDARSHVQPPPPLPQMPRVGPNANAAANLAAEQASAVRTPAEEVYGRLTLRMGGVELLASHADKAIELYRSVLQDYPRSQLGAEAQYRIGFAYETGADDFARARVEYTKVHEQTGTSQFVQQAQQRLDNLDRIDRFRTAGGVDSLARKAEARFLVAEHYLFNLDRPDRALDEYRAIAESSSVASVRARALNAFAWTMSRKLDRKVSADSLFWRVVREYPATEAQLAARDYLEADGQAVPESLIVAPKELAKPLLEEPDSLTRPPSGTSQLGERPTGSRVPGLLGRGPAVMPPGANPDEPATWQAAGAPDSLRRAMALRDSLIRVARGDTSAAGRARIEGLRRALANPDTTGRGAILAEIERLAGPTDSVAVAPGQGAPPRPLAGDSTGSAPRVPPVPTVPAPLPPGPRAVARPPGSANVTSAAAAANDTVKRVTRSDSASTKLAVPPADSSRPGPAATRSVNADSSSARTSLLSPAQHDSVRRAAAQRDSARRVAAQRDSLRRVAARRDTLGLMPAARDSVRRAAAARDSVRRVAAIHDSVRRAAAERALLRMTPVQRDSVRRVTAYRDSARRVSAYRDSVRRVLAYRDSVRRAADERALLRMTPAQRDSVRRVTAKRDSLARVKARADSLARVKAHADSLARESAPAPGGAARPDSVRTDSVRGGRP